MSVVIPDEMFEGNKEVGLVVGVAVVGLCVGVAVVGLAVDILFYSLKNN